MATNTLEWNDYRVVLAIHRTGGLAPAARSLAVNHATVFRQVNAMEARLGARLFDRHRSGYGLTAVGEVALAAAEAMEIQALAAERRMAGGDLESHRHHPGDGTRRHGTAAVAADVRGVPRTLCPRSSLR